MSRRIPEINASSMADIAFLLLFFFLVAATMNVDTGIARKLPPVLPKEAPDPPPVKACNVVSIQINDKNEIFFNNEKIQPDQLSNQIIRVLKNVNNDPKLPEKKEKTIQLLGEVPVSKGIISLQFSRLAEYQTYILVQDKITLAIHELRDELSLQKFNKKFDLLQQVEQVDAIRAAIPFSLSEAIPENSHE